MCVCVFMSSYYNMYVYMCVYVYVSDMYLCLCVVMGVGM